MAALLMAGQAPSIAEQGGISEFRLNLSTSIDDITNTPRSVQPAPVDRITVLEKRIFSGPFPRQRDPQLFPGSLLVIGLDKFGQEIARIVIADPRLIRAEIFDPHGNISTSKKFYQKNVEFSVALPDDPHITSLRFYHPRWTGMQYDLQVIGETDLYR
jgi:hypothetical protein